MFSVYKNSASVIRLATLLSKTGGGSNNTATSSNSSSGGSGSKVSQHQVQLLLGECALAQGDFKQAHQIALQLLQQTSNPYTQAWSLAKKLAHLTTPPPSSSSSSSNNIEQKQLQYWEGNTAARMQLVCVLLVVFVVLLL